MKKFLFIISLFFISCADNNCGDIVDKYITAGKYFFTLVSSSGSPSNENSEGGGQAEVTREVYESFGVGDEYCIK